MSVLTYRTEGLPEITAGVGRSVITPPIGTSLAGYFHDRVSETVRDDLYCNAIIFQAGGERIALVSCDLISLNRDITDPAKALIEKATGLKPEQVLICCTHTHTGPETRRGRVVPWNEDYLQRLPQLIADAVISANADYFDAVLYPGRQCEPDLGSIRLGRKKDGSEVFSKSEVLGPTSSVDPEVISVFVRDRENQVRAVLVNYANHGDVIGGGGAKHISADWFGEIYRVISAVYGENVITVFLNGACGDINHHTWNATRLPISGVEKTVQLGRAVAGLAMNAGEKAEPMEAGACGHLLKVAKIPYYTREEKMRAEVAELRTREELGAFEDYVVRAFDDWPFDNQIADVTLQVLRLGDLAFVGLPGEIFTDWGKEIKRWSPARFTLICELANDWFGYVPTTDQAQRGAYGAKPILSRRLDADGGRQMADHIQVMLHELWDATSA
ncbi:MAG: hypothetical protein HPY44_09640 [Armatimonadetes bacterium]|nr:hypothetical protein [Armatimonadota bacterium]